MNLKEMELAQEILRKEGFNICFNCGKHFPLCEAKVVEKWCDKCKDKFEKPKMSRPCRAEARPCRAEARPCRAEYFMDIAVAASRRATCDRAHVGCVLVSKFGHIIATGYNGALPGEKHCNEIGHLIQHDHCIRTVHAEMNALAACARLGVSTDNSIMYSTHWPCDACYIALIQAGVICIYVKQKYGFTHIREMDKVHLYKSGVTE